MTYSFCGYQSNNIDDFEEDIQHHEGYWCPYCDGFTYFENHGRRNQFILLIEEMYWQQYTTLFVDPPYFGKGKQLYKHYYKVQDHDNLAFLLDEFYKGMPGADIIVTYDISQYIRSIYQYPDELILSRRYSIAN